MLFLAIVSGTLFLRGRIDSNSIQGGTLYLGLLFYGIIHLMFNSYAEQTLIIMSLHVFFKQRAAQFFPAWAFSLPTTLLRIPYSLVEAIQWSCVVYWLAGLAPGADRYA